MTVRATMVGKQPTGTACFDLVLPVNSIVEGCSDLVNRGKQRAAVAGLTLVVKPQRVLRLMYQLSSFFCISMRQVFPERTYRWEDSDDV